MNIINISKFSFFIVFLLFCYSCSRIQDFENSNLNNEYTQIIEQNDYIKGKENLYHQSDIIDFYSRKNNINIQPLVKIKKVTKINLGDQSQNISLNPSNIVFFNNFLYFVDSKTDFKKFDLLKNQLVYKKRLIEDSKNINILPISLSKFRNYFYISLGNGTIIKTDMEGSIIWKKNFNDFLRTPIKLFSDNILILFNSNVVALIKSEDGSTLWDYNYKIDKPSLSKGGKILLNDNLLFFIMPNGILGTIDLIIGEPIELNFLSEIHQKNLLNYNYEASMNIFDNKLSFFEDNNSLYSYDLNKQDFLLYDDKIFSVVSSLFLNNSLLCLNKDDDLIAYNLENKNVFWKTNLSKYLSKNDRLIDTLLIDDTIIIFLSSGKMIQVDKFTGSILFYQNLHLGNINLLSIKENYLLFNQVNGKVVIFKQ